MAILGTNRHQRANNAYGNNDFDDNYDTGNTGITGRQTNGLNSNYDNRNNYNDGRNNGLIGRHNEKRYRRNRSQRRQFDINSGEYNVRPSFGQWLKFTLVDSVTMLVMGAIALGVYFAGPAANRSFPITFSNGDTVFPQIAYPIRHEIFPIWSVVLLAVFAPILIILIMQVRIKSFWDANNAIVGLLYSIISAALFQVLVRWLIGGIAPNFLSVCNPDVNTDIVYGGTGFNSGMYYRNSCRGKARAVSRALESFPSGQSTTAFAGFLFLYFYLNAKMKVFSNHHPAMWKLIVLYVPVLAATLIALSSTIDEYHHWYDCLFGAIIGSIFALSSYRMVFASIWDFRFNHIPLTRHTPFSYGAGRAGAGGFESAVFTRRAGWGFEEAYGGAPFDAAHGLRGQMAGFNQGAAGLDHGTGNYNNHHNKNHHAAEAAVGGGILGGMVGSHKRHDRDDDYNNSGITGHHNTGLTGQQNINDRHHNHHGAEAAAVGAGGAALAGHEHNRNHNSGIMGHRNNYGNNTGITGNNNIRDRHHGNHHAEEALAGGAVAGAALEHHHDRNHPNSGITGNNTTHHNRPGGGFLGGLFGGGRRHERDDPAYDDRNNINMTNQHGLGHNRHTGGGILGNNNTTTGYDNTVPNSQYNSGITGYDNNTTSALHHHNQNNLTGNNYNTNTSLGSGTGAAVGAGTGAGISSILPGHHHTNTTNNNIQYATEPYSRHSNPLTSNTTTTNNNNNNSNIQYATEPYSRHSNPLTGNNPTTNSSIANPANDPTYSNTQANRMSGGIYDQSQVTGQTLSPRKSLERKALPAGGNVTNY